MQTDHTGMLYLEESQKQFIKASDRINHCLNQLDDEDIWWMPHEHCNSIGVILQHVCGNLRQWILSGVGSVPDTRNRPQEFLIQEKAPKDMMQHTFNDVMKQVLETLTRLVPERLGDHKRIQGFDKTLLGAIYVAVTHLDVHAGQILYITRLKIGKRYEVYWKPTTKEQGVE